MDPKPFLPIDSTATQTGPLPLVIKGPPSAVQRKVFALYNFTVQRLEPSGHPFSENCLGKTGHQKMGQCGRQLHALCSCCEGAVTPAPLYPSLTAIIHLGRMQSRKQSHSGRIRQVQQGWDTTGSVTDSEHQTLTGLWGRAAGTDQHLSRHWLLGRPQFLVGSDSQAHWDMCQTARLHSLPLCRS